MSTESAWIVSKRASGVEGSASHDNFDVAAALVGHWNASRGEGGRGGGSTFDLVNGPAINVASLAPLSPCHFLQIKYKPLSHPSSCFSHLLMCKYYSMYSVYLQDEDRPTARVFHLLAPTTTTDIRTPEEDTTYLLENGLKPVVSTKVILIVLVLRPLFIT